MEKIYNSKNFFIRNLPIIAAFVVPVVALTILFAFREIYPFGEEMYLRSDMYHQYATFLKEFQTMLKSGDSLLYTWNIGLGSDFFGTYAYYLASPVNWLVAILPSDHIPEIMSGFIILKAGGMSATFAFYVQKHNGKRNFLAGILGVFYAMSSYMAAYSWNLMWLDCLLLLPIITLGIERLVKKKKVVMYTISLAVAIFSNYYIGIMLCIFLVLYFIYLMICEPGKNKGGKWFWSTTGRFALYSVLAGLMAAIAIVPAFTNLAFTASSGSTFPTTLRAYFNFLEMLSHAIMNVEVTMLSGYIPNIYCTVGLFMMIPLYIICNKVKTKEKIGKSILLAIFLVSFSLNITSYIWHGFHYPNSLSSRQSFIYIFLVLAMAYEAIINIKSFRYREIAGCMVAGVVAIFGLQVLYDSEDYTILLASISVCFLILYGIWMALVKSGHLPQVAVILIFAAIVISEAVINTNETGYSTTSRTTYYSDNEDLKSLLNSIEDEDFYRVEKVKRRTKNDGCWLDYKSASEFSSTTLEGISDLYEQLGMQSSTNSFSYYGHTPLTTAMLGVRYELSNTEINDQLMSLEQATASHYLYKNQYALSLGYMTDAEILDADVSSSNPFVVQNNIVAAATDIPELFDYSEQTSGSELVFKVEKNGRQFAYIKEKLESVKVMVKRDSVIVYENEFTGLENPQIIDIGDVQRGDVITIVSTDDDVKNISAYTAIMEYVNLEMAMDIMGRNQLEIESYSDTSVVGTIEADEAGVMMTSIPYYPGWTLYVDGVKTEYTSFKNAFIAVELSEGEHRIEFRYSSPNLALAVLITIFAILLFVTLRFWARYVPKKKASLPNGEAPAAALVAVPAAKLTTETLVAEPAAALVAVPAEQAATAGEAREPAAAPEEILAGNEGESAAAPKGSTLEPEGGEAEQ